MFKFKVFTSSSILILLFLTACSTPNKSNLSKEQTESSQPISKDLKSETAQENQKTAQQLKNLNSNVKTISYTDRDIVTSGLLSKNGDLWFGTRTEGVFRYDGKTFTNFLESDGLCDIEVWSMLEDTDGNLWFGTANGLCKYDGKTFTSISIPWDGENNLWGDNCNPNVVTSMLQDKKGDIWIGTCGGGAYRYDGKTFTHFLFDNDQLQSDSLHHNLIKSLLEDNDGNIWFSSLTHGGVSRYDGETFVHFTSKDGLLDDMVFASHQDKKGNLWFGCIQTIDGGLYRYDSDSGRFTNFSKEDGLCDNFIMSLFTDKKENLWIGTGKGVCVYDGKSFTPILKVGEENIPDVRFFIEDKEGNIWFGGRYGSLWSYDGKTLIDFTQKRS